jgi:hypothetical protein
MFQLRKAYFLRTYLYVLKYEDLLNCNLYCTSTQKKRTLPYFEVRFAHAFPI